MYFYTASGESVADAKISERGNILYTAGFGNDTVEVVGEIMASNLDLDRVLSRWLYLVFGEEEPSHSYKYIGGGTMFEAINRTICVGHDFYGHRPNPGSCGMCSMLGLYQSTTMLMWKMRRREETDLLLSRGM